MLREIAREALAGLARNRVRAALSMMGISWGIIAVVVLLAYGNGLAAALDRGFRGAFGSGVTIVFGGQTSMQAGGERSGRLIRMKLSDAQVLDGAPFVRRWSPEYFYWTQIRWNIKQAAHLVRGVAPAYGQMRSQTLRAGRFVDAEDVRQQRRVAVIGSEVAREVFGRVEPIGEQIRINGKPFTIVGVLKEKIQLANYQASDKECIFIPYTTAGQISNTEYLGALVWEAADRMQMAAADRQFRETLGRRMRFNPADKRALNTFGSTDTDGIAGGLVIALQLVMTFIGVLTLGIGGVGVMNIMFVSVTERTREIGLRKALGARRSGILLQFLLEGLVTTIIGGAVGIAGSVLVVWAASPLPFLSELMDDTTGAGDIHLELTLPLVLITTTLLAMIGMVSALAPAIRAARLDPIEALRYE